MNSGIARNLNIIEAEIRKVENETQVHIPNRLICDILGEFEFWIFTSELYNHVSKIKGNYKRSRDIDESFAKVVKEESGSPLATIYTLEFVGYKNMIVRERIFELLEGLSK